MLSEQVFNLIWRFRSSVDKYILKIKYKYKWIRVSDPATNLEQAIVVEDEEAKKSCFSCPAQRMDVFSSRKRRPL